MSLLTLLADVMATRNTIFMVFLNLEYNTKSVHVPGAPETEESAFFVLPSNKQVYYCHSPMLEYQSEKDLVELPFGYSRRVQLSKSANQLLVPAIHKSWMVARLRMHHFQIRVVR